MKSIFNTHKMHSKWITKYKWNGLYLWSEQVLLLDFLDSFLAFGVFFFLIFLFLCVCLFVCVSENFFVTETMFSQNQHQLKQFDIIFCMKFEQREHMCGKIEGAKYARTNNVFLFRFLSFILSLALYLSRNIFLSIWLWAID